MDKKELLELALEKGKKAAIFYLIGFVLGFIPIIGFVSLVLYIISLINLYKSMRYFSEVWEEPRIFKYFKILIFGGIGYFLFIMLVGLLGIMLMESGPMNPTQIGIWATIFLVMIIGIIYLFVILAKLIKVFEEYTGDDLYKIARILSYTIILGGLGYLLFIISFLIEDIRNKMRETLVEVEEEA